MSSFFLSSSSSARWIPWIHVAHAARTARPRSPLRASPQSSPRWRKEGRSVHARRTRGRDFRTLCADPRFYPPGRRLPKLERTGIRRVLHSARGAARRLCRGRTRARGGELGPGCGRGGGSPSTEPAHGEARKRCFRGVPPARRWRRGRSPGRSPGRSLGRSLEGHLGRRLGRTGAVPAARRLARSPRFTPRRGCAGRSRRGLPSSAETSRARRRSARSRRSPSCDRVRRGARRSP